MSCFFYIIPHKGRSMSKKDFLSILDLTPEEIRSVIQKAKNFKNGYKSRPLEGKVIALLFEKPSLRTRVSFEVGIRELGGECIYLSQDDVGLGKREPVSDVAQVLDRWVDGIVARVFSHNSLVILAENSSIPIINALSDIEHPCQAIGDLLTMLEKKPNYPNIRAAFVGDGNNVASSLSLGCASVGADFVLTSPESYKIPPAIWEQAIRISKISGCNIEWFDIPKQGVNNADIVYTDVWTSMGQEHENKKRLKAFASFQVNNELMSFAKTDAILMHDMPAHEGEEIDKGMIDSARSVVFDQAENRLHGQKAIMDQLFS